MIHPFQKLIPKVECFSAHSLGVTWELIRNANPKPHLRFNGSESLRVEHSHPHLTSPPGYSEVKIETPSLEDLGLLPLKIFRGTPYILKVF